MSGITLPDCQKFAINWENNDNVTISLHNFIVIFVRCRVPFDKLSYWSMFHVNITSDSRVMKKKNFIKGRPEIRKLVTKFSTNLSNEKLLNAAKYQDFFENFTLIIFWRPKV